jgi:hypothetical protein
MSAIANNFDDALPSRGSRVACAPSIESTSVLPLWKNVLAAMTSIATLISPAIDIAMITSMRV